MLIEKVKSIPGWLHDVAGHATTALLAYQTQMGRSGPVVEIGVFGGRYLALLADQANAAGDRTIGIGCLPGQVRSNQGHHRWSASQHRGCV